MGTIPASQIVQVNPNVLAAGGQALDLVGVLLTTSAQVPIGAVQPFADADDVAAYFGSGSSEAALATIYFNGFDNSHVKPAKVYFAQYNTAAVAAYLRGGSLAGMTLAQLQALGTGSLTISWDGTPHVAASVNLSAVTSFSDAATAIQSGFTTPPFTVAYDSTSGAFVFTGTSSGSTHTVGFASTNAFATGLKLTQAAGAVTSQGADAAVPGTFMDGVKAVTQDWATFMTCFDPDNSGNTNKLAFASWANGQNDRFGYVCWDTDVSPAQSVPASSSLGYLLAASDYSGTCLIGNDVSHVVGASQAAFVCGSAASIDFTQRNGRITFAFKSQTGLAATCSDASAAANLIANGYNFYGDYATANDEFVFFYPGSVSGPFKWFDSFVNEIWLNNQFQLALMVLLTNTPSIPYNKAGYVLIEAACLDVINQGLFFGAFRAGVTLSQAQRAEVKNAAGIDIGDTLQQQGWYFQVLDASPQVRAARGSPPINFWYMDGQSVQKIVLASINVQ
ncbi:MAG TPA: DUF3383 domain-containing protein [Gaiellaceae bacterium]